MQYKWISSALAATICATTFASAVPLVQGGVTDIQVEIRDNGFAPSRITTTLNQPIHLRIHNSGHHIHEFSIPQYRIYTRTLRPGETSDVQFSPWQPGSFDMYSDPSTDDQPEFGGKFIVANGK